MTELLLRGADRTVANAQGDTPAAVTSAVRSALDAVRMKPKKGCQS